MERNESVTSLNDTVMCDVVVRKLLNTGVSADSSNADGLTALHQVSSAALADFETFSSLLDAIVLYLFKTILKSILCMKAIGLAVYLPASLVILPFLL